MGLFAGTPWDVPTRCDRCDLLESECRCAPLPSPTPTFKPNREQTVKLGIEKRKKGKIVTVVRGLRAHESNLPELLKTLKASCGAGGSIDGEDLEVQGDHLDRLRELLNKMDYRVK